MPSQISSASSDTFRNYENVLQKVAEFSDGVVSEYENEVNCQKGCSQCCVNGLAVLPVEAAYIQKGLRALKSTLTPAPSSVHCHFLDVDGLCQIYEFRPLVCRTHGLPLKVSEEEKKHHGSALRILGQETVTCQLNFTSGLVPKKNFVLDALRVQQLLHVVNARFCIEEKIAKPNQRIILGDFATGKPAQCS